MPPITTTVTDTIYAPDGTKPTGRLLVSTTSTWTSSDGFAMLQNFTLWVPVVNGAFSINLVPNIPGTTYSVKVETTQNYFRQVWSVPPAGSPPHSVGLAQVVVSSS